MHARIGWQNLRASEFLESGEFLLITGTDFVDGTVNYNCCHYVDKSRYDQDPNIQVKNGNILLTKDGTLGKVAFVQGLSKPATLNAGVFNIVVKDLAVIDSRYLFHYLRGSFLMDYVDKNATGGTIKHLNQNILVDFPVLLPPIHEQRMLGITLSKIDSLITLQQRKYGRLQHLKQALLRKMFPKPGEQVPELRFDGFTEPWKEYRLGDLGEVAMCKRIYKDQTSDSGDVPFFKIGTFGGKPDAYISNELFEEYRSKFPFPDAGDVLISAAGTIGRTVVYNGERAYYQDSNIVWLKHGDEINNLFFLQFLKVKDWKNLEGSTLKRLYNKDILETPIALPETAEQNAVGSFFRDIDSLIALHQRKYERLRRLKQALLRKMFV